MKKESWHVVIYLLQLMVAASLHMFESSRREGREEKGERRRLAFRLEGDTVCSDLLPS